MRTATVSATSLPIRGRPIFFFGFICFSFAREMVRKIEKITGGKIEDHEGVFGTAA